MEALINEENSKIEKLEREYLIKKKTFDLLPNAEKNIQQLQDISTQSSNRLIELAKEWEKHRVVLVDEYRKLRNLLVNTSDETKQKVEKVKVMRQQIKEIGQDIKIKDDKYRELLQEYAKMQKDVSRSHYTDRILEIVKNVKKQKVDIDKVLLDTRGLQKEINSISDTLNRTFAVIDELVFQDAKKDQTAKEAYKQIVAMNEQFKKLTKDIEDIGSTQNSILTLESKITQMQEKINTFDFDRIDNDLKEMKTENKTLIDQIQMKGLIS